MLLVCDSGSTKADWLLYDGKEIKGPFHTIGFNPLFHSTEFVFQTMQAASDFKDFADTITGHILYSWNGLYCVLV